ncbi:Trk family potassium uptake protein [Faecalicatena contorta]|uniref:TrkH family potassium uptake protein n=1 Tax=Faecalicatena contorta TaxID=39482 RepID=UPI001F187D23|nr:potassium transporter TrkG [Faecalicatena contorta]MCF2679597.1 Trk family potassium uptake protein [Faecalicatena contorta]
MKDKREKFQLSSFQIIITGFAGAILVGTVLLMLPFSTREAGGASFHDAIFTATSAVCVTGLVVHDTATYWTTFGQAVILLLIQIGGMGVVTIAVAIAMISGRRIGLMQRSTLQEAIAAPHVGGIVRLTGFIVKATALIELTGTLVLSTVFCREMGPGKGLWYAFFHSVSAFCNAGFDLMGQNAPFSSLTAYADNPVINITIMILIITGGIGFLTWEDLKTKKFRYQEYRMQTKVILSVTSILILLPAICFYFGEFSDVSGAERVFASLFQSVTPRTAGFNTANIAGFTESGIMLVIILMLIGGSPGSTAGGMKTTTAAVLFASAYAVFRRDEDAHFFGRRILKETVQSAAAVMLMYLSMFLLGGMAISRLEGLPMLDCLFETASAIGTVGLTLGITPGLGLVSRTILIFLMFFGRVGGLTLVFATVAGIKYHRARLPQEKITVG